MLSRKSVITRKLFFHRFLNIVFYNFFTEKSIVTAVIKAMTTQGGKIETCNFEDAEKMKEQLGLPLKNEDDLNKFVVNLGNESFKKDFVSIIPVILVKIKDPFFSNIDTYLIYVSILRSFICSIIYFFLSLDQIFKHFMQERGHRR